MSRLIASCGTRLADRYESSIAANRQISQRIESDKESDFYITMKYGAAAASSAEGKNSSSAACQVALVVS